MAAVGHVVTADVVSILRIRNDGQKLDLTLYKIKIKKKY